MGKKKQKRVHASSTPEDLNGATLCTLSFIFFFLHFWCQFYYALKQGPIYSASVVEENAAIGIGGHQIITETLKECEILIPVCILTIGASTP